MLSQEIKIIKYVFFLVAITPLIILYGYAQSIKIIEKPNKEVEGLIEVLDQFRDYNSYDDFVKRLIPNQLSDFLQQQRNLLFGVISKFAEHDVILLCDTTCMDTLASNSIAMKFKKIDFNDKMSIEQIENQISGLEYNVYFPIEYDLSEINFKKLKKIITITGSEKIEIPEAYDEDGYYSVFLNKDTPEKGDGASPFALKARVAKGKGKIIPNFLRTNYKNTVGKNWDTIKNMSLNEFSNWAKDRIVSYDLEKEKNIMGVPLALKTVAIASPGILLFIIIFQLINYINLYFKIRKVSRLPNFDSSSVINLWTGCSNLYATYLFIIIYIALLPLFSLQKISISDYKVATLIPYNHFATAYCICIAIIMLLIWLTSLLVKKRMD